MKLAMNKILPSVLIILCILAAAACGATPQTQPEAQPLWEVQYPELLPTEVARSASFQEARFLNSVVIFNTEAVTPKSNVETFLAAVENGQDSDLYIWDYRSWNGSRKMLAATRLRNESGVLTVQNVNTMTDEETDSWAGVPDWGALPAERLASATLNSWGYLDCDYEERRLSISYPVVNQRELGEYNEEDRLMDVYMTALVQSFNLRDEWSSPEELQDDYIWYLLEQIYMNNVGGNIREYFYTEPDGRIFVPISNMQETLSWYFEDISRETIIKNVNYWYQPASDTVIYNSGRGGENGIYKITGHEVAGQILTIDYTDFDGNGEVINDGRIYRLTIKLKDDGSFRYVSNRAL